MLTILPESILKNCNLPTKPRSVVLQGRLVRLTSHDPVRDTESLYHVSNGAAIAFVDRSYPDYECNELI